MAKRIHELQITSSPTAEMYLALDQQQGSYASQVKRVIGTVIGAGAPGTAGGDSLQQRDNGEIVLKHTINVPARDETEGGQVNLWFKDGNVAYVDTYTDTSGGYKQNGVSLGKNEKYMRLVCRTNSTNNGIDGWVSSLLVRVSTGKLYMPVSATDPLELAPISAGGSGYDDSNLQSQIDALKIDLQQVQANSGGGTQVAVQATPPSTTTTGAMWWDTNTATMYVYEGAAWVTASPGGGAGGGGGSFSTGWVQTDGTENLSAGKTLTFDHNLGTTDLTTQIWVADNASGDNAFQVINAAATSYGSNAPWNVGASITNITTTSLSVTIAEDSVAKWSSSGNLQEVLVTDTGKYIKVVCKA